MNSEQKVPLGTYGADADILIIIAEKDGITTTPIFAEQSRDRDTLTIGITAQNDAAYLSQFVNSVISIPNQNPILTLSDTSKIFNEWAFQGVKCLCNSLNELGIINLDLDDIRSVMNKKGVAVIGAGKATGDNRATIASNEALTQASIGIPNFSSAKGLLLLIAGGLDMTLFEVDTAASHIRDQLKQDTDLIFRTSFDEGLRNAMTVSLIATGFNAM